VRIVVLGGYGNFGARICRALAGRDIGNVEVIAAGRHPLRKFFDVIKVASAPLDMAAPDFAAALAKLSPDIVIHCAGPFQHQDYRVARASVAAGAHYIDLSDGRAFVAGFAESMSRAAADANVLAVSGASTLPGLSSVVVDELLSRFGQLETIEISIAPGQRAPRGAATLAAVFSYAGRSFKWLNSGAWIDAWGWQELRRYRFAGLGTRWAAACDVPDLELFPARYPGVNSMQFHAALELRAQHSALWLAAGMRRAGLALPLERWAAPLDRVASMMDRFGGERGGMLVAMTGTDKDGRKKRIEWHLTADHNHGPEIPCMPAILLAQKLVRNEIAARGAQPCMGLLRLAEFEPEFARWGITTLIEESAA
jgi:saccharopine dehydrogenase-like NADP-dependent oxidoreductase